VLAGIAAVACVAVLLVGSASSRMQGPADLLVRPPTRHPARSPPRAPHSSPRVLPWRRLRGRAHTPSRSPRAVSRQATNAVEQARAQLQEAASSNNLAALDAAIAHGESVLKTISGAGGPARTQSLAQVSTSEVQKWRAEADQAAAKVEKLEDIQQRARAEAERAKRAEQEWMARARAARGKAQQLAERRSSQVNSLEAEKRQLKERLMANEQKIRRVEEEQSMEEQPAALDVPRVHTNTLRQTYGGTSNSERKVQDLEAELQRQIREYHDAREMVSNNAREQKEQAKEKRLMDEINHIKQARVALIQDKQWSHSRPVQHAARSSKVQRQEQEKERLLAQERKINKEIADLNGAGKEEFDDHAEVYGHDGRKVDGEVSRALQDQEEMPDFVSVGDRGSSKLAKMKAGGHKKHESVLEGFENALGDSKESAKSALHTAKKKAVDPHSLPGVNAYSWWSEKSEKVAAKKAQLASIRRKIHAETHRADKTNCHNLYSCIGSMFSGVEDSSKLARANKMLLHRQQSLARGHAENGTSSPVRVPIVVDLCACAEPLRASPLHSSWRDSSGLFARARARARASLYAARTHACIHACLHCARQAHSHVKHTRTLCSSPRPPRIL